VSKTIKIPGFILFGIFFLAACSSGPLREFRTGDEIVTYDFSEPQTFEEGAYESGNVRLWIADDLYRIRLDRGQGEIWWGQWGDTLDDVVLDVEAVASTQRPNHAYGVGCRMSGTVGQEIEDDPELQGLREDSAADTASTADNGEDVEDVGAEDDISVEGEGLVPLNEGQSIEVPDISGDDDDSPLDAPSSNSDDEEETGLRITDVYAGNGNGYLFLVQGNGSFSIQRSEGRVLTPLVDWRQSDKINRGTVPNELRAVCVGDYLAFYINGEFVGDAIDDTFTEGQVGLMGATVSTTQVEIAFDNLVVSEASPA